MFRFLPAFALLALAAPAVSAQPDDPFGIGKPTGKNTRPTFSTFATTRMEVAPAKALRGETVTVRISMTPTADAWTYPIHPKDEKQLARTSIGFRTNDDLIPVGPIIDPKGAKEKPRADAKNGETDQYYPGPKATVWEIRAVVNPRATPGPQTIGLDKLATQLQVCDDNNCYQASAKDLPTATFEVLPGDPVKVEEQYRAEVEHILNPPAPKAVVTAGPGAAAPSVEAKAGHSRKARKNADEYQAELAAIASNLDRGEAGGIEPAKQGGLWGFLATAALWGLISLVTPCVFPMIPITVSIFLKQAHGSAWERLKLAGVYCLTIITVLGISAFALLKFMAWLSMHPVTNLLLGVLFIVLALSLFGMYELTLPNFLSRRLQSKQQKGGVVGTIFGALAFTVISFTCVAPFLGGFAGISAAGTSGNLISVPTAREVFGGLAFATAFAAPFFVLALVPGLLRALPRSGGWLDSVKVVMGFLELAAALKFLRTAELRVFSPPQYFTYDVVLGAWVAICVACALYLFNVYRLPHDEDRTNIGVPRLLFALAFLGLGVYLLPAAFTGPDGKRPRPSGAVYAWVDAFLLPEPNQGTDLDWSTDLRESLDRARTERKPVLVDFTGVTCTNCKYNETNIFPQPLVREALQKFERVQLYTDEVPAVLYVADPGNEARVIEAQTNREFKITAFGTDQLPLYAVLIPEGSGQKVRVFGVYEEGKINTPDKFTAFLNAAVDAAKKGK